MINAAGYRHLATVHQSNSELTSFMFTHTPVGIAICLTATVPGEQPWATWQRGSLSSSQARIVESLLYCKPLTVFVR